MPARKASIALSATQVEFGPLLCAGDLPRGLRLATDAGFEAVEISVRDPSDIDVSQLETFLNVLHLEVSAIATGQSFYTDRLSLCHSRRETRMRAVDRFKAATDFAARFGSGVILGGIRGFLRCSRDEALESFRLCLSHANTRGVTVFVEPINRYETNFLNTVDEAIALIDELETPDLQLLPDTFHMNIEETAIEDGLRRAGSLIGYVHLADSNRRAPGQGHIDFAEIRTALDAASYSGYVGFEILPLPDDRTAARQAQAHWQDTWAEAARG